MVIQQKTPFVMAAFNLGISKNDLEKTYPRVYEIPFDSAERMTTLHEYDNGKYISVTKGALDSLS